ncbi:olfactory receptor 5V1 [Rhinolophus sinicus]|uniref:olfactory receptor 5V1 n=1 Tax=Rhinolophus sinicus TaxID=89399 RepID=UPI003D7A913E
MLAFEMNNQTDVTEFIFLGFSNHPNLQGMFFLIFLVIYLTTLLGNILIIAATRVNPVLHTPMYYFLSNLSFLDVCYSSSTVPVMLVNFFQEKKTMSYEGCLSQIFFLVTCTGTESVLLAAMAYDRYVAICKPLQYPVLMSVKVCVCLVTGSWLCGLVNSMAHTVLAATLTLCGPNRISHFLCDIPLLLMLSCSDTSLNKAMLHVARIAIGLSPWLFITVSYVLIISAILRIPSAQGRSKAFSTCASHLTVVVIFFGTANVNYGKPNVGYNLDVDILVSVLFCVMTPMLNPIIYSLRNKEVKGALRKLAGGSSRAERSLRNPTRNLILGPAEFHIGRSASQSVYCESEGMAWEETGSRKLEWGVGTFPEAFALQDNTDCPQNPPPPPHFASRSITTLKSQQAPKGEVRSETRVQVRYPPKE